jgi:uncharacterized repeat protein (TIGR04076 family)
MSKQEHKVKITVLKTSVNQELVDLYVERERAKTLGPCEVFREGQEFVANVVGGMPQGFCPWAWDDIYKVLVAYFAGGDFGMWTEGGDTMIACCTDGTRPVYFKLEKLPAE